MVRSVVVGRFETALYRVYESLRASFLGVVADALDEPAERCDLIDGLRVGNVTEHGQLIRGRFIGRAYEARQCSELVAECGRLVGDG